MMDKSMEQSGALALVIDDTEVIRALLADALTDKGYRVHTAANARTGIEMALQLQPDIIFCDTYMPDLDGITAIRQIRKSLPDTIVVLTNSLPTESSLAKSTNKDINYLLNKPFGLDELWAILKEVDLSLRQKPCKSKNRPAAPGTAPASA